MKEITKGETITSKDLDAWRVMFKRTGYIDKIRIKSLHKMKNLLPVRE